MMRFAALAALVSGFPLGNVIEPATTPDWRRSRPKVEEPVDPYYGRRSTGRTGARGRARAMAQVLAQRSIGRRIARGASFSNPFKHEGRRQAFERELTSLSKIMRNPAAARRQAMKNARRVAV